MCNNSINDDIIINTKYHLNNRILHQQLWMKTNINNILVIIKKC